MKIEGSLRKVLTAATFIVLAVLIGIHIDVNINHYCTQLDADLASEALLATVIADNGLVKPDSWYSSSGVRMISSPNIGAFFYKLTGNMYFSLGIACIILMFVLIGLVAVSYRQLGFELYEIFASLIILFSLSDIRSENQSVLFLWAAYYVAYYIALYLMLVFYNMCVRSGRIPVLIWIVSLVVAFFGGLEGLHACLYCYMPMVGIEILRLLWELWHGKKNKLTVLIWLVANMLVALIVPMFVDAYGIGSSRNIRHAAEKFLTVVWPAMGEVVYFDVAPGVVLVICALAAVGYVYTIAKMLRTKDSSIEADADGELLWGTLGPVASIVLVVLALTFTTREVAPRYFFPELFIIATGTGLFMNRFKRKGLKVQPSALVAAVVVMLGILSSKYYYDTLITGDVSASSAEAQVADWMKERGYEYGYAIFDNANSITVISDNAVKVRAVNNMRDMEGCKWLSDSTWYPPVKSSEGKTCYIVSESAREDFDVFLKERNPEVIEVSDVDRFTVYVLDHDYTVWEKQQ